MSLLPTPDKYGIYRYQDGSIVYRSCGVPGKWFAMWPSRAMLRDEYDKISYFDSPEEAAQCLANADCGPAALQPKAELEQGSSTPRPKVAFREFCNGILNREFASVHELFDYGPETAAWFVRHPKATYLQYDHGEGMNWRVERVWATPTNGVS